MSEPMKTVSLRVERDKFARIAEIADARQCTPSDILREAIDTFLGAASLLTSSHLRIARVSEFIQLALDVIISEQYPEYRDRIIANTDKRLEQYHGA